jgi:integrase/recombinase XerD
VVPVGRHAVEWLRRYLAHARPRLASTAAPVAHVFLSRSGRPLDGPSVRDVVNRWAAAAGIETTVSPHALRRSCATEMIRHGASPAHVKEILGHEDFTSIDAYVKLVVTDLKEALERHHPRERSAE